MAEMSLADLAKVYSAGPQADPQSLAALGSKFNQPFGELSASPRPSPTQWLGNKTQDLMESAGASPYVARHLTEGLSGILGFTPLGLLGSAANAVDANARNDNTGTLQAMAGMIPGVGPIERKVAAEAGPMIRAYHGSPHDFDKFSLEKIGTGEGAQSFGHGLYFAENEGVAKSYRDALAPDPVTVAYLRNNGGLDKHISDLREGVGSAKQQGEQATDPDLKEWYNKTADQYEKQAAQYERLKTDPSATTGKMYEVNIKADPAHFLDWDKPLNEQHPEVMEKAAKAYRLTPSQMSEKLLPRTPEDAMKLENAGIPGIKYLDQGSRGAGEGSRNYVVFTDRLIDIVKKYAVAGIALPPAIAAQYEQMKQSGAVQ